VRERIEVDVFAPTVMEVGFRPQHMNDFIVELNTLSHKLSNSAEWKTIAVEGRELSLLKMVVLAARLDQANIVEERRSRVSNADVIAQLERVLSKNDDWMKSEWFRTTEAAKYPRRSDVLTIERAEQPSGNVPTLAARQFDEKFHVLQAPTLFASDLVYYRAKCEMRDLSVAVAFIDIDDFKVFNTEFTYPVVDLNFLPRFMSLLEGHVFGRGVAYRFGGDEYVITLPNASSEDGVRILRAFQAKLERVELRGITRRPTVSIGICEVAPGCPLTNHEIYARAEAAKDFVKQRGKGSIGAYRDSGSAEVYLVENAS